MAAGSDLLNGSVDVLPKQYGQKEKNAIAAKF
ncbi:hypothetical protein ACVWYG_001954 [Pedobacter sp. UYEF25]